MEETETDECVEFSFFFALKTVDQLTIDFPLVD